MNKTIATCFLSLLSFGLLAGNRSVSVSEFGVPVSGVGVPVSVFGIPVETQKKAANEWHVEHCTTVDLLAGYTPSLEPATDRFGGWLTADLGATGWFRAQQQADGRWWMVTPDGHPFICKAVAGFTPFTSSNFKQRMREKFGDSEAWLESQVKLLRDNGFNAAGNWSAEDLLRSSGAEGSTTSSSAGGSTTSSSAGSGGRVRLPYCVNLSTIKAFEKKCGYNEKQIKECVFIFDEGLEDAVEKTMAKAGKFRNDPWCIGYFIDNEIPWRNSTLEYWLNSLPEDNPNHIAALKWLKKMKVKKVREGWVITDEVRQKFACYVFETYQTMALNHLREYDSNHMNLGARFNVWNHELSNPYLLRAAGKYFDVVSLNHYTYWSPWPERLDKISEWAGKPVMITEFYAKGMDSGMPNNTGGGWNVRTQKDRGLFYQNFVLKMLESRSCVGWHWFKYQDNDPENLKADPSNRDSNKGIVDGNFVPYQDLLSEMTIVNGQTEQLIHYFMGRPLKGCISLIDDDFREGCVEQYKLMLDKLGIKCTFAVVPVWKDGKPDGVGRSTDAVSGPYDGSGQKKSGMQQRSERNQQSDWQQRADWRQQFDNRQRKLIRRWYGEGHGFALHPTHAGWYNNKWNRYSGSDWCEYLLQESIQSFKKTPAVKAKEFFVFPGGSGASPDIVTMVGKYCKLGIGGPGITKAAEQLKGRGVSGSGISGDAGRITGSAGKGVMKTVERLFLSPSKHTAEEYKTIIREKLARGEYVILGTHSWEYDYSAISESGSESGSGFGSVSQGAAGDGAAGDGAAGDGAAGDGAAGEGAAGEGAAGEAKKKKRNSAEFLIDILSDLKEVAEFVTIQDGYAVRMQN